MNSDSEKTYQEMPKETFRKQTEGAQIHGFDPLGTAGQPFTRNNVFQDEQREYHQNIQGAANEEEEEETDKDDQEEGEGDEYYEKIEQKSGIFNGKNGTYSTLLLNGAPLINTNGQLDFIENSDNSIETGGYLLREGYVYSTQQEELSMLPLRLCRLVTTNIQFEILKRIAPITFFNNIHTSANCISVFEYVIGSDNNKYLVLVICAIMYAYTKMFYDVNIND
jgi:hypothetical protein